MDELEHIKKLAGINEFKGYSEYNPQTIENISQVAADNKQIERDKGIKPGDPEWFDLWFSLPHMQGQLNQPPKFRGRKK